MFTFNTYPLLYHPIQTILSDFFQTNNSFINFKKTFRIITVDSNYSNLILSNSIFDVNVIASAFHFVVNTMSTNKYLLIYYDN